MDRVRVLSFNVRYDAAKDGTDNWAHRRRLVAGTIRYHDPDIVGVQEAMTHQLRELQSLLPGYRWVGDPRESVAAGGEHTAVGYRTDRFDCRETETFWLSETPDRPGSVGWDGAHPRVATWARFDDLVVLNTHLDHRGERARRAGSELIVDRLSDVVDDEAAVLMGDFNCVAGDPAHTVVEGYDLGGRRLRDARGLAASRHGPTTTRTDFHDLLPGMGIDHVFVSDDVAVQGHTVCTDRDDDHYPSDHLPVVVDCER